MTLEHDILRRGLLAAICRLTGGPSEKIEDGRALHKTRILSGPLAGRWVVLPTLDRPAFALGTYEPAVVRAIQRSVAPDTVCYDVGANAGYLSLLLALVSLERVYAFEADPHNLEALRRTVALNGANVEVVAAAVTDCPGPVRFACVPYSLVSQLDRPGLTGARVLEVPGVSVDAFVFERGGAPPGFIKVDVEGAEDRVLAGAARTLRQFRPTCVVECRREVWAEVRRLSEELGYRAAPLSGDFSLMDRYGVDDLLLTPTS